MHHITQSSLCTKAELSLFHMGSDVEKYTQRYLKQRNIDDMEWTPGTSIPILSTDADSYAKIYPVACFVKGLSQRDVDRGLNIWFSVFTWNMIILYCSTRIEKWRSEKQNLTKTNEKKGSGTIIKCSFLYWRLEPFPQRIGTTEEKDSHEVRYLSEKTN